MNVGIGSTHARSLQVSRALFLSGVAACVVFVKDESLRMPHPARIFLLKGARTPCVTSTTESIAPLAPQYTWKSAARVTLASTASISRCGMLVTVR